MLSESLRPEEKLEVLRSRLETQRKQIEDAKANMAEAEGDEKLLWENRIKQYREELEKIEEEIKGEDMENAA